MLRKFIAVMLLTAVSAAMAAIDINKASEAELDGLKGIGPATTRLILQERQKAEFKDWHDVMKRVKGIGEARATKLSAEGLTVGGASYKSMNGAGKTTNTGHTDRHADRSAVNAKGQPTSSTAVKTPEVKETKH